MRAAMAMSPDAGGIFATLLMLVRAASGGATATAAVRVLIHEIDFIRAVYF